MEMTPEQRDVLTGKVVRRLILLSGKSVKAFADSIGMKQPTLWRRLEGDTFRTAELNLVLGGLGLTREELDAQVDETSHAYSRIPIVGAAPGGPFQIRWPSSEGTPGMDGDSVPRGDVVELDAFAVRVDGESMAPDFVPGDTIYFKPIDVGKDAGVSVSSIPDGTVVLVQKGDGSVEPGCTIGMFYAADNGFVRIAKRNPAYEGTLIDPCEIVGVAVAIKCLKTIQQPR